MAKKVRIYVADDEPMAVSYFKGLVREASANYEIVGEAFQGLQALKGIQKQKPDICFLDISMPVLNGLEVAERVLKDAPSRKIVLLTSYQDFDYAKKGLELGVCAYFLKNELSAEALRESIEKIWEEIQVEKQRTHSYTEQNLRAFLCSTSLENSGDYLYQKHSMQRFALVYLLEDAPIWLFEEPGGFHRFDAICLEEHDYGEGIFCRNAISLAAGHWCALLFLDTGIADSAVALAKAAEQMRIFFGEQGISVSAVLSEGTRKFLDLPKMFQELEELAGYGFSCGRRRILRRQELAERAAGRRERQERQEGVMSLMHPLREEDPNACAYQVEFLLDEAAELDNRREYVRTARNVGEVLKSFAKQRHLEISFGREREPFDSVEQVKEYFLGILREMFEKLERQRENQYSHPVLSSLAFIQEHYGKNISIQDIAAASGISEGHLRKCFRQELGVSLVEYLTNYRIERAKRLMESREYKISEIYRLVGYTSSQYFSYVFKKMEGMTPGEYLRQV